MTRQVIGNDHLDIRSARPLPHSFIPRLPTTVDNLTPLISVVVPVKDEEEAIAPFIKRVAAVLETVAPLSNWEILFVDDGSKDATYAAIVHACDTNPCVRALSLSRNFGKEAALSAGLDHARGQTIVPMDVDLQDPPEVLGEMLLRWREGYEIVCGVRRSRLSDGVIKRTTAGIYYRLHNLLSDDKITAHAGDFRLLDRKVVDAIRNMPERNRFMKGLFAWGGFRQATVEYDRLERKSGRSKYSYWKLWTLALDGITSSSTAPLRIWSYIGGAIALTAFAYAIFIAIRTVIMGSTVNGYPSIIISVMFFGGVQLLSLGVLGEYVGRILIETKQRPIYVVRDSIGVVGEAQ